MAELGEHSGYRLTELAQAAGRCWEEFAVWADERLPRPPDEFCRSELSRFVHGYHVADRLFVDWRDLAVSVAKSSIVGIVGRRWSPTVIETFVGVPAKDALSTDKAAYNHALFARFDALDGLLKHIVRWKVWGESPDERLAPFVAVGHDGSVEAVRWSRWALRGERRHERAFWTQVRDDVRRELPAFLATRAALEHDVPLTDELQGALASYTELGTVRTVAQKDDAGATSVEVVLEARWSSIDVDPVRQRVYALLIPVAYHLSRRWADSQAWPRHVVTCRNPLCGKLFYTGRPNAVACPRNGGVGPSECKTVWDAYQKWLRKLRRNPAESWQDAELQRRFTEGYHRRGRQAPDAAFRG